MLSVLIETNNDDDALARTLASLVGGAVEGIVREVIVCDSGSTDMTHRVADHAGCHFVQQGGLAAGVRQAKGEWLLLLEPGARLAEGWTDAVVDHVSRVTMAAHFRRSKNDRPPFLSRIFSARRPLADGLVVTKRQASSLLRSAANGPALARSVASRQLEADIVARAARA